MSKLTPAQKLGYKIGDHFQVVKTSDKSPCHTFSDLPIVVFTEDDDSDCPKFVRVDNGDWAYEDLECLKLIKQDSATPSYTGVTDSEGWILNTGTEPQYLLDGGVVDVKFKDGTIITNVTDDNRDGDGGDYVAYNWQVYNNVVVAWKPSNRYNLTLMGREVVYNQTGQHYLIEGVNTFGETLTIGSDKDTGAIICKLEDISFVKTVAPSVASPADDTAILEPEVYTDHQEEEVSPKANVGASVNIEVILNLNGSNYAITRDEAYKLYQDLQVIFEEKLK